MKTKRRKLKALDIPACLAVAVLILSLSVVATLFFRQLYYWDMEHLGIPQSSGLSAEDVRSNYDALIDYNSVFHAGELEFPTLPMSNSGRTHFAEVKDIFVTFQIMLLAGLAISIPLSIMRLKKHGAGFLKLGGIIALAVPVLLALIMLAVGWQRFFVLFHSVFFDNDMWIFDEVTDPVILILPDTFFLHCFVMIVALLAIFSAAAIATGNVISRRWQNSGSV